MSNADRESFQASEIDSKLTHETSKENVRCIELIHAQSEEFSEFRDRLVPSNGTVSVLIHPFYSDVEGTRLTTDHRYVTPEYIEKRDELLKERLSDNVPFLVFEPEKTYQQLSTHLSNYGEGKVYTVKTEWDKHMPIGGEESWGKIITILKDANINHIDLGGMFLLTYKSEIASYFDTGEVFREFVKNMPSLVEKYPKAAKWLKEDLAPIGCVGHAAIHFLNSGVDVSLSPVATPTSDGSHIHMEMAPYEEDF